MNNKIPCVINDENATSCRFASMAAKEAVETTFYLLGVDVHSPSDVEKFRSSLRFSSSLRNVAARGVVAMAVVIAGIVVAALFGGLGITIPG